MGHQALHNRVNELATDIGRLRHRTQTLNQLADRLADQLETILLILEPTAAELAATTAPGDDTAVTEAIRVVDERSRRLQRQLGGPA